MHPYDEEYLKLHEIYAKGIKALLNLSKYEVVKDESIVLGIEEITMVFEQVLEELMDKYSD